jgi:hypothetical protein
MNPKSASIRLVGIKAVVQTMMEPTLAISWIKPVAANSEQGLCFPTFLSNACLLMVQTKEAKILQF